ncbi:MAG TPA: electron transfer flavoprotein beta subunit/FixA family protein [Planctomycetes bacterium]|nr:electron transfer flavoprotein beta subunit/FixA family protein [Planctomycetota bacterium]
MIPAILSRPFSEKTGLIPGTKKGADMEILVLVKHVPASDAAIKVAGDGRTIETAGLSFVLNPYDEYAVEEALKTKEAKGGSVTVLTVGGPETVKTLRHCLALGADKAIRIGVEGGELDGLATSNILADKIKELNPELVFCGKQAIDNDDSQIGPRIAARLGWACLSDASTFVLGDAAWSGERDIEGGKESVEGSLPAVITCDKGLNEPRYANMKGIMMAKKKPLEEVEASPMASKVEMVKLAPPPPRPEPTILGEGPDAIPALIEKLKNEVKVL